MTRPDIKPVFVDRKTAAELMMISVDTFDTWVRAGFVPPAHIDRGQITRWHWPSIEARHAGGDTQATHSDPFMERVADVFGKTKGRNRAVA